MAEITREWNEVASTIDGQEYEASYSNGPNINIDILVVAKKTTQRYQWQPYLGWKAIGFPEITHDVMPMQLRQGAFADMRDDPGFVAIVKAA